MGSGLGNAVTGRRPSCRIGAHHTSSYECCASRVLSLLADWAGRGVSGVIEATGTPGSVAVPVEQLHLIT
jgi:hypothetical protein